MPDVTGDEGYPLDFFERQREATRLVGFGT